MGFTGRSAELKRLLRQLAPGAGGTAVVIFAVTGMGGIGKTALAVEAAHRAGEEGWFPGGSLFVDLRGYDENPVTADQALLALLDAMGVRGPDLPPTSVRQYDAYRALLAERAERTLLILDNASDPAQFLDLLPGTDRHRVLITSRNRPDALPLRLIDLETLDPDDSAALVTSALYNADDRDERPALEPEALRELTALCGHLPLALQIAAAMLRRRRHRDIASLVTEIKAVGDATTVLDRGSLGTDQYGRSLTLRPVLETSYRRLPPDRARLLRLLALAPGADTGTEAVEALTGLDAGVVTGLLEDLAAAGLVSAVKAGRDVRWRLHDLVRAYGAGVVAGDAGLREEGEEARARLLRFYTWWAYAADNRLQWLPGKPEPERFADRAQALAWLDGERAGLVAAVQWADDEQHARQAVWLAACLSEYLEWRRYFDDAVTVARVAQEVAHRVGDRKSEAGAWERLGFALQDAGQREGAINAHTRSRDMSRVAGGHDNEAMAWNNLGLALREAGRVEEAIDAHTRALDLYQAVENRHAEGTAWNGFGVALRKADRVAEAIEAYGKSLEIFREFEDWYETGRALGNLANAHKGTNRLAEAHAYYLQAADAYTRANAPTEAAEAQSAADALT